jgi:hypothetical protein
VKVMTMPPLAEVTVAIAVPLEAEYVRQVEAVSPDLRVLYDPQLLPPQRFPADHSGDPSFERTHSQEQS